MSNVNVLSTEQLEEWHHYYDQLEDVGPYHSPEYISFITGTLDRETRAELFVIEDDSEIVYYPYLLRPVISVPYADRFDKELVSHFDAVSSWYYGGPLPSDPEEAPTAEFADAFRDHCQNSDIVAEFIRFDPNLKNHRWFPELDPTHNRETVWVDLTLSESEIWDNFEKRNRNALHQALDTELAVEPTTSDEDIAAFHRIYSNAMEAKDATTHYRFSREFFEELLLDTDFASLLVAIYEEDIVGGAALVHDDDITHDYLRASNPDYWDMRVNNLLCYEALMYAKAMGCRRFDFQGGRPGVFKFKRSFSPERGEFHVARRVHDESVYDELVSAAADAGIDTESGYFPAYRVEESN